MIRNDLPYSPDIITPLLVFGASHTPNSIWEGDPEKKQIVYLAGRMIVVREINSQKVTLIKLSENVRQVHFMGVSPDRKNVIVSETLSDDTSLSLGIYSMTDKTKRLFRILASYPGNYFKLFDFSKQSPNLVLLLSTSNEVYMVDLDKLRHVCHLNLENQPVDSIKVCVDDSHLVSICSKNSIKIYRVQQYTLKLLEPVKGISNYKFTTQMWNSTGLFVGTEQGFMLWIIYSNNCYQVQSELKSGSGVLHITQASQNKLITVSQDGLVLLWQSDYRTSKFGVDYQVIRTWSIPVARAAAIRSIIVTQRLQEIVIGFQDNYIGIIDAIDMYSRGPSLQQLQIDYLYKGSNQGGIGSVDVCLQRSIALSVSKTDRSIRIYNYRLNRCDVMKYYSQKSDPQIQCASIHPSGYYLALGFADKLKLVHLLHNNVKDYKQLLLKHVDFVKFSDSGAYLSVGCSKSIQQTVSWQLIILNSYTLATIYSFVDWNSPIISVKFWRNDSLLMAMCGGGSLRLCKIGGQVTCTKIASRSLKSHTSMAVYQPVNNLKDKIILSVFSCSPHLKEGSTLRQCKQVAGKYVQKLYEVRQYNITMVEVFHKISNSTFRLVAGCAQGLIVLYNIPFDGIPLFVINAHSSSISSLIMSPCGSLLFSGCKNGILICSQVQSWQDVSKTPEAQCLDDSLSDIMLVSVQGLKDTEDKNKKLTNGINQVQQRSKQIQRDLKGRFQQKLRNIIVEKDIQIQNLEKRIQALMEQKQQIISLHKQELNEIQNKNSLAVSDLEGLFQRKIFLQTQQNVKLRHHIGQQEGKYKEQLQQIQSIHADNINTLTQQFNQMLSKTANLYRKETTKQKVSEKGYQDKLKIIDEQYQDQIQRLIQKHNQQQFKKTDTILKLNREIDSLKSNIRSSNNQITDKNRQISYLKEQIEDLMMLSDNKQKNIRELDTLLGQKQAFVTQTNNRMTEMREKYRDTEKKKAILNIKAAEWRQAIQPKEKEIERLREKLYELQGELDNLISKQSIHMNTIQTLETEKNRLNKITKQQSQSLKSQENLVSNILMDIKTILDKPKQSNRSYHEEIMQVFKKYNTNGDRHLGGNTIESLGQINRQVMHLQKTLDIKNKTTKKAMDQRNLELGKKSVENNQLIRDLNEYKVRFKEQKLELKGKQKIIDDLMCEIKQNSLRKSAERFGDRAKYGQGKNTDRTTKQQTPVGITRSNSLRVHKILKGSNYEPTLISNQKKQRLIEITSQNELMRQYILKLESKQANIKEKIMRHLKQCESTDRILQELIS